MNKLSRFFSLHSRAGLFLCIVLLALPVQSEEDSVVWVDVRTASEFHSGHVSGALNIEYADIVNGLSLRDIAVDQPVLLYCGSGRRAGVARQALIEAGYTNVTNVGGLQQAREFKAAPTKE